MELLTYRSANGEPRAGLRIEGNIYDALAVTGEPAATTVLSMLQNWSLFEPILLKLDIRAADACRSVANTASLAAPVLYPGAVYCAAANYRDHMHAMALKLNQPDEPEPNKLEVNPYHFVVPGPTCIAGPDDPILIPAHGEKIDWEIELVAVIGRAVRRVPVQDALSYVAAYTIGNDVSVRDGHFLKIPNVPAQSLFRWDVIASKGFDRSCTIGPWLTLARDVPDPQRLAMKLWIDGDLMQDSSTAEMVFSTAEQISYLSQRVTLHPGDLVMTGTPAGTGMERDRFLRSGETLRLQIEHLGEMTQQVS